MEGQMHFTIDGAWLADFVRSRYHYENAMEQQAKTFGVA